MKTMLLATATALSLAAMPVAAQQADAPLGSTNSIADKREYTADQQAVYDALEPEQRMDFDAWAYERQLVYFEQRDPVRVYYWTLEPDEQVMWWQLTPAERVAVAEAIEAQERQMLWDQYTTRYAVAEPVATTQPSEPQITYVSNEMAQPVAKHSGEYPVCKSDADDACINAWEAGKRGAGVNKPLDNWPGEPASS